jgi:guanylate kinase
LWFSVSANTRAPRPDEVDGRDYLFVTRDAFERMRDHGELLEWFEVYDDLKGTPRTPIRERLKAGDDALVEVDVQGALEIKRLEPDAVLVFVKPPSREAQRARLRARAEAEAAETGTPLDEGALARRMDNAEAEEARAEQFDAVVVNDDLDHAVEEIEALLATRRRR